MIINNLLPGPFATDRQIEGMTKLAAKAGQDYEPFCEIAHEGGAGWAIWYARRVRQSLRRSVQYRLQLYRRPDLAD
jgi:hypothetical protein